MRFFNQADVPAAVVEEGRAWQRDHPLREISPDAELLFCVPVKGKAVSNDWNQVNRNLNLTLQSLLDQTDRRWRAIVCCQDQPDLPGDPRIAYLAYPVAAERGKMDKRLKHNAMYEHHSRREGWDGYVFNLDADDIVHPGLVEHFLTDRSRSGYILPRGYLYDVGADSLGSLQPPSLLRPWAKQFYRACGSCSAVRVDLRDGPAFLRLLTSRGKHRHQKRLLEAFGVALEDVDFPAAVYVVNHGDNEQLRRGNIDSKTRYVQRNKVRRAVEAEARKLFRLDRIRG